jgi:tetratricopeptide (TPR) repeat protein
MQVDVGETYREGYAAFDDGDYQMAIKLATETLAHAPANSYWRFGALGLRCWAANFLGQFDQVHQDTKELLYCRSGYDQRWFDGMAWLNRGFAEYQSGDLDRAKEYFSNAWECYAGYKPRPKQPPGWAFVVKYFAGLCRWAATGAADQLESLSSAIRAHPVADCETDHLQKGIEIMLRFIAGEDMAKEAQAAIAQGVNRTYLAFVLLPPDYHPEAGAALA